MALEQIIDDFLPAVSRLQDPAAQNAKDAAVDQKIGFQERVERAWAQLADDLLKMLDDLGFFFQNDLEVILLYVAGLGVRKHHLIFQFHGHFQECPIGNLQPLERVGNHGSPGPHLFEKSIGIVFKKKIEDIIFGIDVVVDAPQADSRFSGDLPHRSFVVALLLEDLDGPFENLAALPAD